MPYVNWAKRLPKNKRHKSQSNSIWEQNLTSQELSRGRLHLQIGPTRRPRSPSHPSGRRVGLPPLADKLRRARRTETWPTRIQEKIGILPTAKGRQFERNKTKFGSITSGFLLQLRSSWDSVSGGGTGLLASSCEASGGWSKRNWKGVPVTGSMVPAKNRAVAFSTLTPLKACICVMPYIALYGRYSIFV